MYTWSINLQQRNLEYVMKKGKDSFFKKWCWENWKPLEMFLKKLKIELPYNPVIPLMVIYLRTWNHYLEEISAFCVHCSIIYHSQDMKTTYMSTDDWVGKENVVYIYNGILYSHKTEGNPATCNNIDGTWVRYAKWNKLDRERQILYNITYIWNLKISVS